MEPIKLIKNIISHWFTILYDCEDNMSPEETVKIAKTCTVLDVAQVFLGYDDEEMSKQDDRIRDICNDFIKALNELKQDA